MSGRPTEHGIGLEGEVDVGWVWIDGGETRA